MTLALLCVAGSVSAQEDEIIDFDGSFYHNWSEVSAKATDNGAVAGDHFVIGQEVAIGGTIWGDLSGAVPYLNYANITEYSELRIEGTPGATIRLMCNRTVDEGPIYEIKPAIGEDGKLTIKISDLKYLNGGTPCDFVCLQSIKVPASWAGGTMAATITSIKIVKPGDPLSVPKEALKKVINAGKLQNSFAKTADSFAALTSAISAGESALENATSAEELEAAAKAITDAISGLELADGYTTLTQAMFKHWDNSYVPTTSSNAGCAYTVGSSTGQPYGDGSVVYLNFADISEYSKLILTVTDGTPRIMMNREEPLPEGTEGRDGNGGSYVQITDAPVDGVVEVDLTQYDYAHLNAIKGANWQNVTVTGMLLYRTVAIADAGWASFGSLDKAAKLNGATVYAAKYVDGSVKLTTVDSQEVPAGVGVLVEGSGEIVPTFDVEAGSVDSDLKVSNGTVAGNGSIYVLANGGSGVGFYKLAEGVKIPAGKAYLEVNANGREFIGFGDATGIKSVETVKANGTVYNLAGQQVKSAQKGVFIVNGKKVIK